MAKVSSSPEQPPQPCAGPSGLIMVLSMVLFIMIIFDPSLRAAVGLGLNALLYPLIGFGGRYPIWTLFFAALLMVFLTTVIRHYTTDWVEFARVQKNMAAYQKEYRDATLSRNMLKLNKLRELQPEIMKMHQTIMFSNLKTMMFTMIIAIAIFIWIYTFAGSIAVRTISLPWEPRWPLTEPIPICGAPGIGYWIIIYTLLSIPISQLILRSLKYISFSKEVKLEEALEHTRVAEALTALENAIADADKLGVRVPKARELLQRAKRAAEGRSYEEATMHTKDAENLIEEAMRTHKKTIDLLDTAKSMLASAEQRGIGVRASLEAYKKAEKAMRNMEYSTAIYYAKQTQRLIKEARKQHKTSEEAIADMKSVMYDIKDIKAPEAERLLREAERAMASKEYDKVLGLAKEGKRVAEKIRKSYQELLEKLARAQELLRECKAAGIEVDGAEELLRNADTAMRQQEYEKALGLAVECIEYAEKEKGRYQEATEAVSFAKLVIANAEGFGVDVAEPRSLLQRAEDLLAQGDYENTIKYATQAKDLAEGAKRRMQRELKRMR